MSDEGKDSNFGFIGFRLDKNTREPTGFQSNRDLDTVKNWCSQAKNSVEVKPVNDKADGSSIVGPETPSALLAKLSKALSGFHPLISTGSALSPLIRSAAVAQHIYRPMSNCCSMIEKTEVSEIYALANFSNILDLNIGIEHLEEAKQGTAMLPSAIIMAFVATFDTFITDTMRMMMKLRPERLHNSNKQITIKEVMSMASFEDVIERCINDELDSTMRGSHESQVEYIEKYFSVGLKKVFPRWSAFVEIFERRNLAAHGALTVNEIYVTNCAAAGMKIYRDAIGRRISLSPAYLHKSVDILIEFGAILVFKLWAKHFREQAQENFLANNELAFSLISRKRYLLASRLLDFSLAEDRTGASERLTKMMTINAANAHKKLKNESRFQEIMKTDFSALSADFQLSVASLKEDIDEVLRLMPIVSREGLVSAAEFRLWPVFDWVKDDNQVSTRFEEVYGEPIILSKAVVTPETAVMEPKEGDLIH